MCIQKALWTTFLFLWYNLMQDKFVESSTQSVRHLLDFRLILNVATAFTT